MKINLSWVIAAFLVFAIEAWAWMIALGMVASWTGLSLAVGFWPAAALSTVLGLTQLSKTAVEQRRQR